MLNKTKQSRRSGHISLLLAIVMIAQMVLPAFAATGTTAPEEAPAPLAASEQYEYIEVKDLKDITSGDTYAVLYTSKGAESGPVLYHKEALALTDQVTGNLANGKLILADQKTFPEVTQTWVLTGDAKGGYTFKSCSGTNMYLNLNAVSSNKAPVTSEAQPMTVTAVDGGFTIGRTAGEKTLYLAHVDVKGKQYSVAENPTTLRLFKKTPVSQEPVVPTDPLAIPGYTRVTNGTLDPTKVYMIVGQDSAKNLYAFYPDTERKNTDPGNAIVPDHTHGCPEGTFAPRLTVAGNAVEAKRQGDAAVLDMAELHFTLEQVGNKWAIKFKNGLYLSLENGAGYMGMLRDSQVPFAITLKNDGTVSLKNSANRYLNLNVAGDPKQFKTGFATNFWGPTMESPLPIYFYTKNGETVTPPAPTVDKNVLKDLVKKAEALQNNEAYTAESRDYLAPALTTARAELINEKSTAESIKTAVDELTWAIQAMVPVNLAPERPNPDKGTTKKQPFINGETGGSNTFRIPAITTLKDGSLAAAIDARWDKCPDGYGIDTLFSVSHDNGETWNYNFPNYFNDSVDAFHGSAAAFIDPVMVQGKDNTIYLMVDVFPGGKYIGTVETATGYEKVDDQQRLVLYRSQNGQNDNNWAYYVGDFVDGLAPVIAKGETTGAAYYVDDHYYLYTAEKKPMYCQQLGSSKYVKQNVFYTNADLHVRNATYLWLVTSTDGGQNWSAPTIMNPMVRPEKATQKFYGVGPGAGLCLEDGTIMLPCYTYPNQIASFIYKNPNETTWHRSDDSTSDWSSESVLVQIDATTVRHFYRDGHSILRYTDHVWDQQSKTWKKGTGPVELPGVTKTYNNQLSAIRYSEDLNGKPTILVSTAATGTNSRQNGKIYVFSVNENKTMDLISTYQVNKPGVYYGYSSLTQLKDGSIGLLYEDGKNSTYLNISMEDILQGTVVDLELTKGETYQSSVKDTVVRKNTKPEVADAVIETESHSATVINGAYGHEGTDKNYSGTAKPLSSALYRFSGNSTDGFQIMGKTEDGTKVWASTAVNHRPSGNAPETATVTVNKDGTFCIRLSGGYLFFWRDGRNSFDRVDTLNGFAAGASFKLYRPAAKDEKSSEEVPGYVQIKTMAEIQDGGFYLIAASVGQDTYVMRPYQGGGDYSQALKVDKTKLNDNNTVTDNQNTLTITGKRVGTTDIAVDNTVYRVTVTGAHSQNRDNLRTVIARAEQVKKDPFTEKSWNELQTALTEAKTVLENVNADDTTITAAADKLLHAVQAMVPVNLAPEHPSPANGITKDQPFPAGVPGGSKTFRIPALTTLKDGSLAAAIDARWNKSPDGHNIDTLFSISKDNGKTWEYSFPNYFNDATDYTNDLSTAFIDPVMVQGNDGTIYLMVDLFPAGHYIVNVANDTGYRNINGKQCLVLYTSLNQNADNWSYYVGEFDGKFAPVIAKGKTTGAAYYVDDHYYLYTAEKQPMYCQQLGSDQYVKQNVFYHNAELHVRNATYLWLVTSKDNGKTWSAPTIMNPMVRPQADGTTHRFYGVGPGAGLCLSDGTIMLPCYTNTPEKSSFIYKNPNEDVWHRSENATTGGDWSSENALVEIDVNTVREFCRDGVNVVRYTDHVRDPQTMTWKAQKPVRVNGVPKTTANQVSAIRYAQKINDQDVIMVSTAATGTKDRQNGKIYAFALNNDPGRTMTKIGEYEVTAPGVTYGYSSLTQQEDGSIGLLYEDTFIHGTYRNIQLSQIIPNAVVDGNRTVSLSLYETVEDPFHFETLPTAAELSKLDQTVVKAEIKGDKVLYTGLKAGKTSYVTGDITVTIKVNEPADMENLTMNVGDTKEIAVEKGQLTTNTNKTAVGAEVMVDDQSFVVKDGAQGHEGANDKYNGSLKPLSGALYQFSGNSTDGFQIMGKTEDGTNAWVSTAVICRPSSNTPETAVLTQNDDGTFFLKLSGGYLHFYRDGRNRFDRVNDTTKFVEACKFKLYRPAAENEEPSKEIPGYVQVTKLADVKDGGFYLIVAGVKEDNFVLRPCLNGGDYSQALKVDLSAPKQTTTVENKYYTLKLTAKSSGTADVVVDGQLYRVTVNGSSSNGSGSSQTIKTDRYPDGTVVETTTDRNGNVTANITLPNGLDGTTVTVPTGKKPSSGTVAVKVNPDGTKEVIRKSVNTEKGVTIPVDASMKVEIVDNAKSFTDTKGHWAKDAIDFVTSHELYAGTGANTFSPDQAMSRGMLAAVLHNRESNPKTAQNAMFSDVKNGTWYSEAVAWAIQKKIVSGYGNGEFGPDDQITREQLAVMLYQYAGKPEAADGQNLNFVDADQVSSYAQTAVRWAVQNGIINGMDGKRLAPKAAASRAQVAAMLLNFCKNEVK